MFRAINLGLGFESNGASIYDWDHWRSIAWYIYMPPEQKKLLASDLCF